MLYVDLYPPVYVQPEVVIEQRYVQPEYVIEQPVYVPYPTVRVERVIQTPSSTVIIDRTRERIYPSYDYYREW